MVQKLVLYGDVYDQACEKAYELAAEHGYTFIHPFDDLRVATGQGTIAMEVIQDLPLVDYILVPIAAVVWQQAYPHWPRC